MSDGVFGGKVTAPVTVVTILDERRNARWYIFFCDSQDRKSVV